MMQRENQGSQANLPNETLSIARQGVEVIPVTTSAHKEAFVSLPWDIYRDDPLWVPPLRFEVNRFISKKHPFYEFGSAQLFLAMRGGKAVGRILVSDDPNFNALQGTNLGCFGLFESEDHPETSAALLDAAKGWLKARGRSVIRGPIDYSMNYPCGLLIEGFDTPPRVMMNHNPQYYAGLLEAWGLTKVKDLYAWWFTDPLNMMDKWRARADRLAARGGVVIRPFRRSHFREDLGQCVEVYRKSWRQNWGFSEMTEKEIDYMAADLKWLAIMDLVLLAEVNGKLAGMAMTLPDFNEAWKPLNGRLTSFGLPIGAIRFLWRLRHVKAGRLLALGVLEEYRRRGVLELLILRTLDHGKNARKFHGAELSWTLEDNRLMNEAIATVGAIRYKTFRIYEKPII